jgi:hypothetical protein
MMDINKYILSQIKIDEKLLKLVEQQQEKQPTKVMKHESKQKPNSFLLDLINENIKNEKRLTNHYKSIATGLPVVQEDDNIRLISSHESHDINLENQFNFLMSKYVKDQTQLNKLFQGLTPEMLAELVHNFSYYEQQIRQYRGQYVNDKLFLDKLRNMLLKNVNLKYPATISLNSAMDASKDPAKKQQEIVLEKNKKVNEKHSQSDPPLAKLEFIIGAFGKSPDECSKQYELADVVFESLTEFFKEISDGDTYDDIITIFSNAMKYYIKSEPQGADNLLNSLIAVYTGTYYVNQNPPVDIRNLIQKDITNKSFRTKVIRMVDKKYKEAYEKSTHKKWFKENLVEDFNKNESNFKLDINYPIDVNTYYFMSNANLIYFSMILDKLGTDEQLLHDEIQEGIYRSYRSRQDLAGLKNKEIVEKIALIRDADDKIITTNDMVLRTFLDTKDIQYSKNATAVENMFKKMNATLLKELYDRLLDHYHPIKPGEIQYNDLQPDENTIVEETKEGHGLKPSEKQIHKKYFIDTQKLNNNILELRYAKNRHLTNIKSQFIGHGVKNIIHSIINDNNMNQNEYHVLTEQEKHLIRTILHMLDKAHLLSNADEAFNERFQILLSEYNAGNNSEILRNQIKQYILHAMKLNMIGRQAGQQMIIEMCF